MEYLTYGLGIGASSSNALTIGAYDGTAGEYGRLSPNGLSDLPAALSLKVCGGAKSMAPIRAKESSLNLDGVGKLLRADGGGIGRLGPLLDAPVRPDAEEYALGPGGYGPGGYI